MEEKYIISGKELERYFDFNQALHDFNQLFTYNEKDDRTIVIIGGTFLEMVLEHILQAFLPENEKEVSKLFEYNNALGNFSNKINLAYCLGLIDFKIKEDLHRIRKIRNEFAHDMYATFENQKINDLCTSLQWHKIAMMMEAPASATSRDLYQVGVNTLISHLSGCIGIARNDKRKTRKNL